MPILTAAQVGIYINGSQYAIVSQANWNVVTGRKPIFAVDSSIPYEIAPTTSMITGNLAVYRLVQDGGLEGAGITLFPDKVVNEPYVTITLIDLKSDTVVFAADQCVILDQRWEVPSRGIVHGQLVFQAINWSNEAA